MSKPALIGLPVLLLAATLLPGPVHAFARFDGIALAGLTLTSIDSDQTVPGNVSILYGAAVTDWLAAVAGSHATAAAEATLDPAEFGDMTFAQPLRQGHSVAGWAGDGKADARMLTAGFIFLTNNTAQAVTFTFSYDIGASFLAEADPLGIQARVDLTWLIDDLTATAALLDIGAYADLLTGPKELRASGTFDYTLAAGGAATLSSLLDSWGVAEAPEPPVWVLLAAGLVAGWRSRFARKCTLVRCTRPAPMHSCPSMIGNPRT